MATFANTITPTPFALFDADTTFQADADNMINFVKTKLGDPQLSVELTSKQIWACFEEATAQYGAVVNEYQIKSQLSNMLGMSTSSNTQDKYLRQTLEFLLRQAEPYAQEVGGGGSYDTQLCYIPVVPGQQDYNLYTNLYDATGSLFNQNLPSSSLGKLKIMEVFHFSPLAAQQVLLNASNITNYLATEFSYESYVNSTVFYVLPIFEDVLRRGMLETASRVRRSNFSYQIVGRNLRIFPIPTSSSYLNPEKIWIRVQTRSDPLNPSYTDPTLDGVSNISNAPYSDLTYNKINSVGRQWIRQYAFALCKETLGQVRSKFKNIPIPNAEVQLNGEDLLSQAREDKDKMLTTLRELLTELTYDKLIEKDTLKAENLNKQLRYIPVPFGKAITQG
jgi:hypothetical protein